MPLFSVVVPTYNRKQRLLRAVRSVLAQRFVDYEIVVVDDGSTDGTFEALAELGGRVHVVRQQNRGPGAARTAGARAATGEYVVFLDSDDEWLPWTLAMFARALEEHRRPAWLYGSGVIAGRPEAQSVREAPLAARFFPDYATAAGSEGLMPLPTGVAVSREVFIGVGGFQETMRVAEDLDLWFRIGEAHGFVLIDSPALYVREVHEGSLAEDVPRSFAGMMQLVGNERDGVYGGAPASAFARRAIISRQLMYYAERYRSQGQPRLAARFYLEVLRLQALSAFREAPFGGKRNRFLLSFPVFLASPSLHTLLTRVLGRERSAPLHSIHDRG